MIISEKSIQQVRDLSITDVISHYEKLDRNGRCCCPFHAEKTPSFKVTETKGMFKCFGCGVAGDHITFVMNIDKLGFIEAIERIAGIMHITLEYEEVPDKEKYEQEKSLKDKMREVLQIAVSKYRKNLLSLQEDHPVKQYLTERNITPDIITDWQLGWSGEEWHSISPELISLGLYEPAHKLGIIKRANDDRNFDGYRSRIIIPITGKHGDLIGLAGRFLEVDVNDQNKNYPKYINPPQNELYDKSVTLYGLSKADKKINAEGYAYLVEGYFDVITLHTNEEENTIGSCGTALTEKMALLIKKYTNHVVVFRDGDAAGRKAAVKDISILTENGLKTEIALLPDGEDPDSYKRKSVNKLYQDPTLQIQDAILWYVDSLVRDIADDTYKLGQAQQQVLEFLIKIPNDIYRSNYLDAIVKKHKWKKNKLEQRLNELLEEKDAVEDDDGRTNLDKLPKWMDREEFRNKGYCSVNNKKRTGYYSISGETYVEITNFVIRPLFHIYAGKESRHLIQIDNGRQKAVIDIESKALVAIDLLQQYIVCEGPFIIYGSKAQMLRIATNLLANFPRCLEIKFLGWQQAGFFAFVDKIFVPGTGMIDLDEWGILKHDDHSYLLPAASAAYKELQKTGEDPFEPDRCMAFKTSSINFSQWANRMQSVYLDKGNTAVAFTILTAFRDIIFDIDNNCPHLYCFGERTSGKSKWAESISAVFYQKRSAFNLNSGTDFAFFAYMQRFINCPAVLNEFDESVIKPEWFQVIKGIFDGEGRQRGVMGSRNRTEIMKVRSTLVLIGQYLCTMDDNSIVSRSIIEGFNEREFSEDEKQRYEDLKLVQEQGLGSLIIELLQHRVYFKEKYRDVYNETLSEWRRSTDADHNFNQRIMQNWAHLLTSWQLIAEKISLPVSVDQFKKYCRHQALRWSKFIRNSDTLSEFWNTFSFLADQGLLIEGWDYQIHEAVDVRLRKDRNEEYTQEFTQPTKLLYVRMNNVHKHYQQAYRQRNGKEGMSIDNLMHYFSSRKYFLGTMKQKKFKRFIEQVENAAAVGPAGMSHGNPHKRYIEQEVPTSCHVFLYSELGLEIERQPVQIGMFHQDQNGAAKLYLNSNEVAGRSEGGNGDIPF